MSLKLFFGILSIIPAVFAYYFYLQAMFAGKTKPHAFSWLVWGVLAANGFFAQVSAQAGIGAWATGATAVVSLVIFGFAVHMGTTQPQYFDWLMLGLAVLGFALLLVVDDKTLALCLTLLTLAAGFAMTIRKAYWKPAEENARAFTLNMVKFLPAILALSSFSFLTVAYPVVAAFGNAAVALTVYIRARQLAFAEVSE